MISITTQVSSIYVVKFKESFESKIRRFSRRVSRVATLDGGSVVNDSGFSHSDRTLIIEGRITETQRDNLEYMFQTYPLLNVAAKGEIRTCAPGKLECDNGKLKLTFLVVS